MMLAVRRTLLPIAAVLSLILFLTTPFLWLFCGSSGQHWHFTYDTAGRNGLLAQHNVELVLWRQTGFEWSTNRWTRWTYRRVTIPCWALAAAATPAPLIWLARRRRAWLANRHGLCPACGYDLRASQGRCPECGTPISIASRLARG